MRKMLHFHKIILLNWILFINGFSLLPRDFKVEHISTCPNDANNSIRFEGVAFTQPLQNQVAVSGNLIVSENITKPLELELSVSRCNHDMTYCEDFDRLVFKQLCNKIIEKNAFWSPFFEHIQPRIKCPVLNNTYKLDNDVFDMSIVSRFPAEGYHWLVFIRIFELNRIQQRNRKTTKHLIFCLHTEVAVFLSSRNRKT